MKPWRQARAHWDFAAELLLKAAQTRKESDIEIATRRWSARCGLKDDALPQD
jgi:hypothetical protein